MQTFEITMRAKGKDNVIYQLVPRVQNMTREQAINHVTKLFPEYDVYFVIVRNKYEE